MDIQNIEWIKARPEYVKGELLDIGCWVFPGQDHLCLRNHIDHMCDKYTGLDLQAGPNVDIVCDAMYTPFEDGQFDTIITLDAYEHMEFPWKVTEEIARILKPGGHLFLATVMNFPGHCHPDYFRFTPMGLKSLVENAGLEIVTDLTPFHSVDDADKPGDHLTFPGIVRLIAKKPLE